MFLKACLNGSRTAGEHPTVPLTPEQLAQDTIQTVAAGVQAVHLHVRAADGTQTLDPDDVARTLTTIRARCPGVPLGISTASWIEPDPARRLELVRSWTVLPDFASVNFVEPGAVELCMTLLERGIGIEPGLGSSEDARLLLRSGLASSSVRVLLEPEEQELPEALHVTSEMLRLLEAGSVTCQILLHGFERTAWPLLEEAARRGLASRIGLEDTLLLPDGRQARSNEEMVTAARRLCAPYE
ncbi:uncharacterized protein (DUF849 family) [Thermosporothrix hazakensis]|uniref:Uncharacterized protein (DUF849 family) n=2 Tax=Thermosporothrix TaxID=768650 RepID=A0A326U476_THEHA|nr:3-keto-5-aminohexanoate cleavage protein [Thermosporothrix hazakensis]PZW27443.1 uncharacterized protein (DUF849 family) [Thermosporothrix hazakensis]BBH85965.1 hypothetical protein KTC_07160 [Thermosporothrix sp. COM3]GCE45610.1 hypothetical protein KTH_04790 [Thermosporothrix hazakensis]